MRNGRREGWEVEKESERKEAILRDIKGRRERKGERVCERGREMEGRREEKMKFPTV